MAGPYSLAASAENKACNISANSQFWAPLYIYNKNHTAMLSGFFTLRKRTTEYK
jgi:hypothetical protein